MSTIGLYNLFSPFESVDDYMEEDFYAPYGCRPRARAPTQQYYYDPDYAYQREIERRREMEYRHEMERRVRERELHRALAYREAERRRKAELARRHEQEKAYEQELERRKYIAALAEKKERQRQYAAAALAQKRQREQYAAAKLMHEKAQAAKKRAAEQAGSPRRFYIPIRREDSQGPSSRIPVSMGPVQKVASTHVNKDPSAAATTIQAAFKGYLVRKLNLHKNLAILKDASAKVEELKETYSASTIDLKDFANIDRKQFKKDKIAFSELLMQTLLRLDLVEGCRERRRAAVKEIQGLLDRLDSLEIPEAEGTESTDESSDEGSVAKADDIEMDSQNDESHIAIASEDESTDSVDHTETEDFSEESEEIQSGGENKYASGVESESESKSEEEEEEEEEEEDNDEEKDALDGPASTPGSEPATYVHTEIEEQPGSPVSTKSSSDFENIGAEGWDALEHGSVHDDNETTEDSDFEMVDAFNLLFD